MCIAMASDLNIHELAAEVLRRYQQCGLKIRTAESCTAGGIAAALASVPGVSCVLDRGWIVYSNQAKQEELAVGADMLTRYGAVSREVVQAMAAGGLGDASVAEATVCVAVSGIAGPDGGSGEKPVGTVWMALDGGGHGTWQQCFAFSGDRAEVQMQTVVQALHGLLAHLNQG